MKNTIPILGIALFLMSCSTVATIRTDNHSEFLDPTRPSDVRVYITDEHVDSDYVILGELIVATDAASDSEKAVSRLKKLAAELGADAIINLRLEYEYGYFSIAIKATGTAISTGE